MRLRLLSDLHSEHWGSAARLWSHLESRLGYFRQDIRPRDVMCLCGDIGHPSDPKLEQLLGKFTARWPRTLFVPGNHEFYDLKFRFDRESALKQLRAVCDRTGVKLLDRERVDLDGVSFFGCTLWSAASQLDFWMLHDGYCVFRTHEEYLAAHARDRLWLDAELAADHGPGERVVLTHHLPTPKLIHQRYHYRGAPQTAFMTPLDELVAQSSARFWFSGHTHESMQARVGQTLCAVSPLGYPEEQKHRAEPLLDQAFTL